MRPLQSHKTNEAAGLLTNSAALRCVFEMNGVGGYM